MKKKIKVIRKKIFSNYVEIGNTWRPIKEVFRLSVEEFDKLGLKPCCPHCKYLLREARREERDLWISVESIEDNIRNDKTCTILGVD